MNILEVKDLMKTYKGVNVVNKINFSVKQGEIFGLLGPNGAGKSTTIEIIAGLKQATSGQVVMYETTDILKNRKDINRAIGVQLQSSHFYDQLTVIETIKLFLRLNQRSYAIDETIELTGIRDLLHKKVKMLSGGEKQKLSLALTIANDPELIILDEPTTGLDPQARLNLWEHILAFKKMNKTVVITTHFMEEAQYLCDTIAIMNKGEIKCIDTLDNLLDTLDYKFKVHLEVKSAMKPGLFDDIEDIEVIEQIDTRLEAYCKEKSETCVQLIRILESENVEVSKIEVMPFDLQDVFVNITGRRLEA